MWYGTIKKAVEVGTATAIRQVLDERLYRDVEYTDVKYATQKVFAGHEVTIKGEIGIAKEIDANKVKYQPSMIEVVEEITRLAKPGDVVVTLGAGDVNSLAPVLLKSIEDRIA